MYKQTLEVMYSDDDGWKSLRDVTGAKVTVPTPSFGQAVVEELKAQEGVTDAMVLKVEEFEVYHPFTRVRWPYKLYTGLTK